MDTLTKSQIEAALAARLPSYNVTCTLHADGTCPVCGTKMNRILGEA